MAPPTGSPYHLADRHVPHHISWVVLIGSTYGFIQTPFPFPSSHGSDRHRPPAVTHLDRHLHRRVLPCNPFCKSMTVFSIGSATKPVSQGRSSRVAPAPMGPPDAPGDVVVSAHRIDMSYRSWGEDVQVLHGVDLEIYRGEVQLLMGPSGSGKTTLLSILAGILTPTGGSVTLMGQDITRLNNRQLARFRLEHIGFIFQGFNLFPALTAQENVEVALNLKGIQGRTARRMAMELLDHVALSDKAASLPKQLSGGQKQRVAIARALAANPPLVFADEPTAALDAHSGHGVMDLLHGLAKEDGATVVIVTHDPRIVDVADRIAYMEDGQLRERAL